MVRLGLGLAVVLGLLGFGSSGLAQEAGAGAEAEAAAERADPAEVLVEQLLATDRAWNETPPDADAFAAFFAAGGRFFPPGAPLAAGSEAILSVARPLFASPGFSLQWRATGADVAASGDLGFTFGTFVQTGQDEAGSATRIAGKYVTVWRRGDDRTWRVVADIFNSD
jgi:ketosteroid isomerase-like protein